MEPEDLTTIPAQDVINNQSVAGNIQFAERQDPMRFARQFDSVGQRAEDDIVRLRTQEAEQRNDLLSQIGGLQDLNTAGQFQSEFDRLGGVQATQQLADATSRLAQLQGKFRTEEANVESTAGTAGAKAGILGEIDRQEAVAVGNQALVVQALQGNVTTARQTAMDVVNFTTADRQAELDQLISQYNAVSDIVTGQEKQVIDANTARAQEEKAQLERTQQAIDTAIMSGDVSVEEMQRLTSLDVPEQQKQALAQQIVARGAGRDAGLDRAIKSEQLRKLQQPSTSVIDRGDGMKQLINSQTGEVIATYGEGELEGVEPLTEEQEVSAQTNISQIDNLKVHDGLNSSVGPIPGTRTAVGDVFGAKDDFIASIDQLTKDLTLTNLINAKAEGATFGALSNAELQLLSESATKINNWREGEKNEEGAVIETTHYDASEKDFKEELDKISNYRKLDYVLKGGNPEAVGIITTDDGHYWTENSDGSLTKLR